MGRQQGFVKALTILFLGLLIAFAVYWFRPQPSLRPPIEPVLPSVSVLAVDLQSHRLGVNTQGTVAPQRRIDLVAEVAGRVIEVSDAFADGAPFAKGELLFRLDDSDYQYQLVEAESQIATAARELALEKGQARQAKREWRDLGSQEANALFLRQPQVRAAEAQLAAARAQRDAVRLDIERTIVRAPFAEESMALWDATRRL